MLKHFGTALLLVLTFTSSATDAKKAMYHPCFLMDNIDARLDFIKTNASKIFVEAVECKQTLLDSISEHFIRTGETKYLDALSSIRQNPGARVENYYTNILKHIAEKNFSGLVQQLYLSKGKFHPLEKELITVMNMIVDGRPYKRLYVGLLNVEIEKAKDIKDKLKIIYLDSLKKKIQDDRYR